VFLHQLQTLQPVIGLERAIPLAGQVDVQSGYDVLIVVADEHSVQKDHLIAAILARQI